MDGEQNSEDIREFNILIAWKHFSLGYLVDSALVFVKKGSVDQTVVRNDWSGGSKNAMILVCKIS